MRARSFTIVGLSVGMIVVMILCFDPIVSLIVPILLADEGLQGKAQLGESKAEREHRAQKARQAAYSNRQAVIKALFDQKRESSEFCQVHEEKLKPDHVRIAYGLILPPQEYVDAQQERFPNSNRFVHGGCVLEEPEFAYVLFCTRCREEESRWEDQHHEGPRIEKPNNQNFILMGTDEATAHLVKEVKASYPRLAEQVRITGVVKLNLYINKSGKVTYVELLKGHPLLSQAAIDAARNWKYRPFIRNGAPVQVVTVAEVPFNLEQN